MDLCSQAVLSIGLHTELHQTMVAVRLRKAAVKVRKSGRRRTPFAGLLIFLVDELFRFLFREADDADFHWVVEILMFLEDFGESDVAVVAVEGRGLFFGIFAIRPWYGYMGVILGRSTY